MVDALRSGRSTSMPSFFRRCFLVDALRLVLVAALDGVEQRPVVDVGRGG
jgi:hypothetical protein